MSVSEFEWDRAKAESNLRKHGVAFDDAITVFDDAHAITVRDPDASGEERLVSVGMDATGRILVIVFVPRDDRTRLISARRASPNEQLTYLAGR